MEGRKRATWREVLSSYYRPIPSPPLQPQASPRHWDAPITELTLSGSSGVLPSGRIDVREQSFRALTDH